FRTRIANIGPYEQVAVAIGYQQVIDQQAGEFRLRLPLAVTPRYRPEPLPAEQGATAGDRSALEDAPTAPPFAPPDPSRHRVAVEVLLDAGLAIDDLRSHFHAVDAVDLGSHYRITLQDRAVAPDRDFELSWRPRVGAEPEPAVFLEEFHGRVHALVTLMPPPAPAARAASRELVFVIDTSGSMEGASLAQAKAALLLALDRLRQQDTFNVVHFNSQTETLYQQSVAATTRNKRAAVQYVMALRAHGGTEMAPALRTAFRLPRPADDLRQVIFITDGAVSNERELFDVIEAELGSARLFTVGIGSAPNGHLMRRAARSGRGTHTFVASSDQVHERMTELFERIERPVVTDIRIDWPDAPTAETAPSVLPDLYSGEPIIATARLGPGASGLITITGQDGTGHWTRQVALPRRGIEHEGIARTWARHRIDELLGHERAAVDPASVRGAIVDLALEYQLTSPHTSLVAIAPDPVRPAGAPIEHAAVASSLPAGMAANLVIDAFPRTATAAPLHLAIGLCAVVLGLLTLLAGRRLS
ncbi:MAG TPA: marine proteobacterial sortase target protein, partial [Steroidobacteraceae bacterium]|nr:marine proteobacterial sortase target protein [Steroidobacteraceae bacterium]